MSVLLLNIIDIINILHILHRKLCYPCVTFLKFIIRMIMFTKGGSLGMILGIVSMDIMVCGLTMDVLTVSSFMNAFI